ncbi:MAG TPA: biotin/lipoate--protein ligase family protein [Alphaproteobacteria bacterium]|nr:biotin/lipoate--protein ligase family protein [Alphaproteobacteria bacterium]
MSNAPEAPPIYRTVPLPAEADAVREATRAAASGADPATLFWVDRSDRAQCAITLSPDVPLRAAAQIVHVGMTTLGNALGATLPPLVVVGFRLPTTVLLNDAVLGRLRVCRPASCGIDDVPDWLVIAIDIGVTRFAESSTEATDLSLTTFEDEGCMGISTGKVSGAFARYLLAWIDRWQKDGFDPIRTGWMSQARIDGGEIELHIGGHDFAGRFGGLSDTGGILLESAAGTQAIGAVDLIETLDGAAG